MKRSQVVQNIRDIVERYRDEPKQSDTLRTMLVPLDEFVDSVHPEWIINIRLDVVEDYAFLIQILFKHHTVTRFSPPMNLWLAEPEELIGTQESYDRAMSGII